MLEISGLLLGPPVLMQLDGEAGSSRERGAQSLRTQAKLSASHRVTEMRLLAGHVSASPSIY